MVTSGYETKLFGEIAERLQYYTVLHTSGYFI